MDILDLFPELKAAFGTTEYLISALVWSCFILIWLAIVFTYPRPVSLRFDLLLCLFAALKAVAGFTRCSVLQLPGDMSNAVKRLGEGEFALLILIVARGWGLTRMKLTLAEIVAIVVYGGALVVSPILVPLWLVDCVVGVMIVVFAAKTYTMLDVVYPGISLQRNQLLYRKRRIFTYILVLSVTSLLLPVTLTIGALVLFGSAVLGNLKYLFKAIDYFSPILLAVAMLLLQLNRNEEGFGDPIVDAEDVYRVLEDTQPQSSYSPPPIPNPLSYSINPVQAYPSHMPLYASQISVHPQQVKAYPSQVGVYPPQTVLKGYSQGGL